MKKKLLFSLGALVLLFFGALFVIPLFLEARIGALLKQNVNANIHGRFDFDEASLSLIASFPNARLQLEGPHLITQKPFEGDTLFYAGSLNLEMGIMQIFKGADAPIAVENIVLSGAKLYLKENAEEQVNYNITRQVSEAVGTNHNESSGFALALKSYTIEDSDIAYFSAGSGLGLHIRLDEHQGSGDLSLSDSKLDTQTQGQLTIELDSLAYLSKTPFSLKALIGMDLEQNQYRFLENEALLDQLVLVFKGMVQVGEGYQDLDIRFNTPKARFQDFLSLLPASFVKELSTIKASGDFESSGFVKGKYSEDSWPDFGLEIHTENAALQYSGLSRSIDNISFQADITNEPQNDNQFDLQIQGASFQIAQDQFRLDASIKDLLGEKYTGAHLRMNMDLARLGEAYPMPQEMNLNGQLNADLKASFAAKSIEQQDYAGIKTDGSLELKDFVYNSPDLESALEIDVLGAQLTGDDVIIKEGKGQVGQSDFQVTGSLQHLIGYFVGDQVLQGKLNLMSNTFLVSDIVSTSDSETEQEVVMDSTAFKIPMDLDIQIQALAGQVVYDDLELQDFKGKVLVKDGIVDFQEVTTGFLEGTLALGGTVDTKQERPQFAMALELEELQIQKAFESVELVRVLAPVAQALNGKFSSQVELSGLLNSDFAPELSSLSGGVLAEVLAAGVQADRLPVLTELNSSFDFFDAGKLDLSGMKTALAFENGRVRVRPFRIKYDDIALNVEGGHGFDRSLDYQLTMNVPPKYLGKEIQGLVASIGQNELKDLSLPVHIGLKGTHNAPKISSDLSSGMKTLTNDLIELQKQKLVDKGKEKAQSLIGDLLAKSSDTVPAQEGKEDLQGVLKGLMNKPKDSLVKDTSKKEENPLEKKAQGLLKGLLKGKKKDTSKTRNQ